MMIKGLNHITFAVNDIEKSFMFYKEILGFKPVARWKNGAYLLVGNTWIALNFNNNTKTSMHNDYSHIAFSCQEEEFSILKSKLLDYGCSEWAKNESEGESFYFTDPDGHKLEIHVGDLNSRLKEMHNNPWDKFKFY